MTIAIKRRFIHLHLYNSMPNIHYGEHLNISKSWEVELENEGWQGKFSRI